MVWRHWSISLLPKCRVDSLTGSLNSDLAHFRAYFASFTFLFVIYDIFVILFSVLLAIFILIIFGPTTIQSGRQLITIYQRNNTIQSTLLTKAAAAYPAIWSNLVVIFRMFLMRSHLILSIEAAALLCYKSDTEVDGDGTWVESDLLLNPQ